MESTKATLAKNWYTEYIYLHKSRIPNIWLLLFARLTNGLLIDRGLFPLAAHKASLIKVFPQGFEAILLSQLSLLIINLHFCLLLRPAAPVSCMLILPLSHGEGGGKLLLPEKDTASFLEYFQGPLGLHRTKCAVAHQLSPRPSFSTFSSRSPGGSELLKLLISALETLV